jgi:signal transduction histidine kinase
MDFLRRLFSTSEFMPHGMCYNWQPGVIWLHVLSDATIALAYYSIPLTLIYFVRKRKDLAFDWMFLCFAIFIIACGTTHVMEIFNIWQPTYWLSGVIKLLTALASIVTAVLLIRLIPQALALPSPDQLRRSNLALQNEVRERQLAVQKVESLNEELVRHASRIESVNKELEVFAYSVSHDLRAPLRHVDGYVTLLREEAPDMSENCQRYMAKISDSARQMGVLIDNLLAFSGMGRAAMQAAWTETDRLVAESREELAPETKGRDIEWKIAPLPRVFVDPALFKQVWMNLLGNAVKYTRKRDKAFIEVGCHDEGDRYEFFVKDNGAGFDMKYADKLFGIFQRLHRKEEFEGTGIGLANVQRILARHGGRIWAQGTLNEGATFSFTLPKNGPRAEAGTTETRSLAKPTA